MRDDSTSIRNLVIGMLLVAAPFAIAYLLTRGNPNAEILLIVAIFCLGLAAIFGLASGLQQVGGVALRLSGRPPRDIMIVGLAALSLLTPWTIAVDVANLHQIFGWTNPLAWLMALGLLTAVTRSARPYHGWALVATGVALIGWVIAVDAFAARRAREPALAQPKDVWPLSLVPGMGLVRLGYFGRGRLWLAAAVLAMVFIGISAVNDSEFAYWAHYDTTPPDRGRLDVALGAAALTLVIVGSWVDTWRSLRRREIMGDWLAHVRRRSQSESR